MSIVYRPQINGLDAVSNVSLAAVGSSPNANAASISSDQALNLQPADGTNPGVLTAGTQTIGGAKTFSSTIAASNLSGTNTGNVTLTAVGASANANGASLSGQALTLQPATASFPGVLLAADFVTFNSKQAAGNYITALTGDITASGPGSVAATLATVNSNVGSFGSSTSIPNFTVNAKGLITAAGGNVVVAPAGTLSGVTLNATVVSSSLTSVGTIATGVWNGTAVDATHGGTAQTTYTLGDTLYASATNALSKRPIGSTGDVLTVSSSAVPTWTSVPTVSFLAATSSAKTPGGSGQYLQMTGNSVALTVGDWMLTGKVLFNNAGASSYTETDISWTAANGADSGSTPAALSTVVTIQAGNDTNFFDNVTALSATAFYTFNAPIVRVTAASTTSVFLVPFITAAVAANCRVTTYIYAQKVGP